MGWPGYNDAKENVRVTLRHQEKTYAFVMDLLEGSADFMFTDGNYGCDCNKSLFIGYHCDPNFPEMGCGDKIELISLEVTQDPPSPLLGDDEPDLA
jgi:hypothetical protein